MRERKNQVRVGADEFAAALLGKIENIELPKPGQWIRQVQRVMSFVRGGQKIEMVSPTEGEVVGVNAEVVRNPATLRQDPYGKGWLVAVHVQDEENTSRNLVPKGLVREWMRDAVERLYSRQPALAGAVAADGGRPADQLPAAGAACSSVFLSAPESAGMFLVKIAAVAATLSRQPERLSQS